MRPTSPIFVPFHIRAVSFLMLFKQPLMASLLPDSENSHIAHRLSKETWDRLAVEESKHVDILRVVTSEDKGRRYIWLHFPDLSFPFMEFPEPQENDPRPEGPYAFVRTLPQDIQLPDDEKLKVNGTIMRLRHFHIHARQHSGLGA